MGFFYELGRKVGPKLRTGRWLLKSFFGSQKEGLEAEDAVGRDLVRRTLEEMGRYEDESSRDRLDAILSRLRAVVARRDRRFRVHLVRDENENAFALPGGWILVTQRLYAMLEDDDEMAFVLAHEMGHVIKRHAFERIVTEATVGATMAAVPKARVIGSIVKATGRDLLQKAYSRDREFQADRLAVGLCHAAGFDPRAASRLCRRLSRDDASGPRLANYFATHPPLDERRREIEQTITALDKRETDASS